MMTQNIRQSMSILLMISQFLTSVEGQAGTVSKPATCGSSAGCISNCQSTTCGFIASWTVLNGTTAEYTLTFNVGQTSGSWVAIGFSSDQQMGNDSILGCATDGSGKFLPFSGINSVHSTPALYSDTEVILNGSTFVNSVLSCTLQRPIASSANGRVDVNNAWTMLLAHGSASISATNQVSIYYHNNQRFISQMQVKVSDRTDTLVQGVTTQAPGTTSVTSVTTSVTTQTPSGTITKPAGCGNTAGCVSNCQGAACGIIVSWNSNGNTAVYTLTSNVGQTSGSWVAVGFSSDQSMGNDDVMGCATDGSGKFLPFSGINGAHQRPAFYNDTEVMLTASTFLNGILSCKFQRPISGSAIGRVDVSMMWTLLLAYGPASISAANQISILHHTNRYISQMQVKVSDRTDTLVQGVTTQAPTTEATAMTINKPSECKKTKGCFSNCDGSTCGFVVSWNIDGSHAIYTLASNVEQNSGNWIAVGFSKDKKMGDDDVLGCAASADGTIVPFTAYNNPHTWPTMYTDSEVQLTSKSLKNGELSCTLRRPVIESNNGRVNVNTSLILLFATGRATLTGMVPSLSKHGREYVSDVSVKVSEIVDLGAQDVEHPLIIAHGSLMIGAWIFLASIGIVLARYYKPVWTTQICSQQIWFLLHRLCMVLVFCATAAGFIIIFIEIDGYSNIQEDREFLVGHPIIGIIVMILTFINPIMAIFRPHPGTPRRPIFNWGHWLVGTLAHILGVINIFFGVLLTKSQVPFYLIYILGAYVAWQLLVEIVLEILSCFGRKMDRSEAYELSTGENHKKIVMEESTQVIFVKRIILVVHCFVVAAFAAVLIGLLATGKERLDEE